jgi:ankyrin repeat protein
MTINPIFKTIDYKLFEAIRKNNSEEVIAIIAQPHIDINKKDSQGYTLLQLVIFNQNFYLTKQILNHRDIKLKLKSDDGYNALHIAAIKGNVEIIKLLLSKNLDVNEVTDTGLTALHLAINEGNLEAVTELLNTTNIDINIGSAYGTPLQIAVQIYLENEEEKINSQIKKNNDCNIKYDLLEKNFKILEILLKHQEAKLASQEIYLKALYIMAENGNYKIINKLVLTNDIYKSYKSEFLIIAAKYGHFDQVKAFLDQGADINKEEKGLNALYAASKNGHIKIVTELLNHGANPNKQLDNKIMPLYIAAKNGHLEIARKLIEHKADVNREVCNKTTALHIAVQNGDTAMVIMLLENGADANKQLNKGITALYIAAQNGEIKIVAELLKHNAAVNIQRDNQATALIIAAHKGHIEIVKILLKHGADVNKQMQDGRTALHSAINNAHQAIIVELLKYKADINKILNNNIAAINLAVQNKQNKILEILLEQENINLNHKLKALIEAAVTGNSEAVRLILSKNVNIEGELEKVSLLCAAAQSGDYETTKIILDIKDISLSKRSNALCAAVAFQHLKIVELLLVSGVDIKEEYQGAAAIYFASYGGNVKIVQKLIEHKANVNQQELRKGYAPLHIASKNGHYEIVKLLFTNGANLNLETRYKTIPLHEAILKGHKEVIIFLINQGSDINKKDNQGHSILDYACNAGDKETVKLLLEKNLDIGNNAIFIARTNPEILFLLQQKLKFNQIEKLIKDQLNNYIAQIKEERDKSRLNDIFNFISIKLDTAKLNKQGTLRAITIAIKTLSSRNNILEFKLKIEENKSPKELLTIIDNNIIKKIFESQGKGGIFSTLQKEARNYEFCYTENSLNKATKEELLIFKAEIKRKLTNLESNLAIEISCNKTTREEIIDKIIKKLNSIKTQTIQDSLEQCVKNFSASLQEVYSSSNYTKKEKALTISRAVNIYRSLIINQIRAKLDTIPNQIQLNKSKDSQAEKEQTQAQITQAQNFIDEILSLVKEEQKFEFEILEKTLNNISPNNPDQEPDLREASERVKYLEEIYNLKELSKPKTNPSPQLGYILNKRFESLFLPQNQEYNFNDLKIPQNLKTYDLEQLKTANKNLQKLRELQQEETIKRKEQFKVFFTSIVNNLIYNDNFAEEAQRIAIIVKNIITNQEREDIIQTLWDYKNYSKIIGNDIDKIAEFFVGINFINNFDKILSDLEIKELVKNTKADLKDYKTPEASSSNFVEEVLKDKDSKMIENFLLDLIKNQQFTTILYCTPHNKALSNPHIANKTSQNLVYDNLTVKKEDLEDLLEIKISDKLEKLLEKTTLIIAANINNGFQKRGSGSHNACFKIPKILPHKNSELSSKERLAYIKRIQELENTLDQIKSR